MVSARGRSWVDAGSISGRLCTIPGGRFGAPWGRLGANLGSARGRLGVSVPNRGRHRTDAESRINDRGRHRTSDRCRLGVVSGVISGGGVARSRSGFDLASLRCRICIGRVDSCSCPGRFGFDVGLTRGQFGIVSASFRRRFEPILGRDAVHSASMLDRSWVALGSCWGRFGVDPGSLRIRTSAASLARACPCVLGVPWRPTSPEAAAPRCHLPGAPSPWGPRRRRRPRGLRGIACGTFGPRRGRAPTAARAGSRRWAA